MTTRRKHSTDVMYSLTSLPTVHSSAALARALLALSLSLCACDLGSQKVGDEPTDSDATSDGSTSADPTDTESPTSTSGDGPVCEDVGSCAGGSPECELPGANCGGAGSIYTEDGCVRQSCGDDSDCPEDHYCKEGFPSSWSCEDVDGECQCGGTADGNGAMCVPDVLSEHYPCSQEADEASCAGVEFPVESNFRCIWVEPVLLPSACDEPQPLAPRCLLAEYQGDGCGTYCDVGLVSWRFVDEGVEAFEDPSCEYLTVGFTDEGPPPGFSGDEIACLCSLATP